MKTVEVPISSDYAEYNNIKIDCRLAIKNDINLILQEAESSHKESFEKTYIKDSLRPNEIRLYLDNKNMPQFGMIIYIIDYKDRKNGRYACGNYYPLCDSMLLTPHPFQASICW